MSLNQNYDFEYLQKCAKEQNLTESINQIKLALTILIDNKNFPNPSQQVIQHLETLLKRPIDDALSCEVFRVLRNASTLIDNRVYITDSTELLGIAIEQLLHSSDSLKSKIILQFLANLVISNQSAARILSLKYIDQLTQFLKFGRNINEVSALFHYINIQNPIQFRSDYVCFIDALGEDYSDFIRYLIESFLYDESFWSHLINLKCSVTGFITLLDILKELWIERKLKPLPDSCLHTLSSIFVSSMDVVFQTANCVTDNNALEAYKVSLCLDILGFLCSEEKYQKLLRNDKELIIRSSVLLINIHRLGKSDDNYFSTIQKLSELKNTSKDIKEHPAFAFKVGLVKLIGNLCSKNNTAQNLIRECEVIPVLLECCNIDARNPLIMQWVILAIRHLCEGNEDNKKFISSLQHEGVVNSALLEEMGITLETNEKGKIRVVPLNLK